MQTQLQQMVNDDANTIIIVNVDKTRKVQEVINVMDAVNGVKLPPAAMTPDNNAPAVMIATTPVDANGNAVSDASATPSTTAPSSSTGVP